MSEFTYIVLGLAVGAFAAAVVGFLLCRQRLIALRFEFDAVRARDQLDAAESVNRKVRESEDAFSVRVEPFVRKVRESGFISKKTEVEIGYQYQLFVRGVPAFEPHKVIVEHHSEKEITEEGWERLVASAQALAAAAIAPELRAAEKLVSVVKTKVLRGK